MRAFEPCETDIAGFVKWALEIKTGIACRWQGESLVAEAERECVPALKRIAGTIRGAFAELWARFERGAAATSRTDRKHFMAGLYDGMMSDERAPGATLPVYSVPKAPRAKKAAKRALIGAGVAVHPYACAVEFGRQIRANAPLEAMTRRLETDILGIAS